MKRIIFLLSFFAITFLSSCKTYTLYLESAKATKQDLKDSNILVCFSVGNYEKCDHVKGNIELVSADMIQYLSIEEGGMVIRKGEFTIYQIKK